MMHFHAGGRQAYTSAMRAEYNTKRQAIAERLRRANSQEERTKLAAELRELNAKHHSKTAHWGNLLF